ncbi:hypothetical protein KGF54_000197 [Candida jiufengensis]|uniref:uncharacterized protein n=1 Tax=Candida jiufengensis TaxID=497108 RepID=UPI0022250F26|nr:uncharacterized protein KGF54_000197 [Candida jiufengensis]KAI5957269.1 hypothetical protein KGF54_000197 [Candida jiufengensis]
MCFNNIKTANEKLYDLIIDAKSSSSKKRYSDEKLTFSKLTNWRFNELPIQVKERYELGNAYITQDELYFLVLWKLNLGSFKPIAHHIKKNMPEDVIKITNRAFNALLAFFMESKQIKEYVIEDIKLYGELVGGAIEILKELAGVGTATASLVLNCLQGINENLSPPFITEESIMYLFSNENLLKKIDTNFYIKEMLPVYFGLIKDNDLNLNFSTIERGVTSIYHYKLHQSIFSFASPFSEEDWFKFSPSESVKSYQKEFEDQSIPTGFKMRMNAEAMAARATTQNNSAPESNSSWIEQALTTNNSTIGISKSTTSQPSTKSDMKTQIKVLSGVNALTELSVTTAQRVFSVQQKLESLEDKIEDCVAENQKLFVKVDQLEAIVRVQNQKILDILGGLEDMVAESLGSDSKRRKLGI